MPTLATSRSLLFVPGSDERKLITALSTEADCVIADLEDAVLFADEAQVAGKGAVALDGEMIDLPIVERARRLLETTERSVVHGN